MRQKKVSKIHIIQKDPSQMKIKVTSCVCVFIIYIYIYISAELWTHTQISLPGSNASCHSYLPVYGDSGSAGGTKNRSVCAHWCTPALMLLVCVSWSIV